jgi:CubicO group peptidase (beta-lactamase class C family)
MRKPGRKIAGGIVLGLASVLLLAPAVARADELPLPWPDLLEGSFVQDGAGRRIDERFEHLEGMGFAGVVLVMRDGLIVLHDGYGVTPGDGDSIDARALFPAGAFERVLAHAALRALERDPAPGDREPASLDEAREAIERASGLSYEEALRALILQPTGMKRAVFGPPSIGSSPDRAGPARPLDGRTGSSGILRRLGATTIGRAFLPVFASSIRGAAHSARAVPPPNAGLFLTTADLYRWELALRMDDGVLPEEARSWGAAHTSGTWPSPGYQLVIARDPERRDLVCVLIPSDLGWSGPALAAARGDTGGSAGRGATFLFLLAAIAVIFLSIGTASHVRRRRPGRERRSPIPF